ARPSGGRGPASAATRPSTRSRRRAATAPGACAPPAGPPPPPRPSSSPSAPALPPPRFAPTPPPAPRHPPRPPPPASPPSPATHPAAELAALYHERWELELAFDELKTHTCERVETLRSKAPARVEQEVWGLLLAYNLVRLVMSRAAPRARVPPVRLSYRYAL